MSWVYDGKSIGKQPVTRNRFQDGNSTGSFVEDRQVFCNKSGRYIIMASRQHYITNDNHLNDHNYTLDVGQRNG